MNLKGARLSLCGMTAHRWPSVERTRASYIKAFQEIGLSYEHYTSELSSTVTKDEPLFGFSGPDAWSLSAQTGASAAICLHGGAILNYTELPALIEGLAPGSILLGNCKSDVSIIQALDLASEISTVVVRLPIDVEAFSPGSKVDARHRLDIPSNGLIFGVVSRLIPHKNLHLVIEALKSFSQSNRSRPITLLVVGNFWPDYPVLRSKVDYQEYIVSALAGTEHLFKAKYLPANIPDTEMASVYRAMDVLLNPSHSIDENFGYVCLEAMACGTPVIGCAYGGLKDSVKLQETGQLLPTWMTPFGVRHDRLALSDVVGKLVQDLGDQFSEQCRSHVRSQYSFAQFRQTVQDCIHHIRGRTARGSSKERRAPISCTQKTNMNGCELDRYYKPMCRYVSDAIPIINYSSLVYCYSRWRRDGDASQVVTDDPTWPMIAPEDPSHRQMLFECQVPTPAQTLSERFDMDVSEIQHLVNLGYLVVRSGSPQT